MENNKFFHEAVNHTINIQLDGRSERLPDTTPSGELTHGILKKSETLSGKKEMFGVAVNRLVRDSKTLNCVAAEIPRK